MKTPMILARLLAGCLFAGALAAEGMVVVQSWTPQGYTELVTIASGDFGRKIEADGHSVTVTPRQLNGITQWRVDVANRTTEIARLRMRIIGKAAPLGGDFWDGYEAHRSLHATNTPTRTRYVFPAIAYTHSRHLVGIGYAPDTVSSRFERHCRIAGDTCELVFDSYLALHPGQHDSVTFIRYSSEDADDYTELVEAIYRAYPRWFRPVPGADERLYGMGGYYWSSQATRNEQREEARRVRLSWEWYYNMYQKAGDFFPTDRFWDKTRGYKTESAHAKGDTPGTVEDWVAYNQERISAGDRQTALFYYHIQQFCNAKLLTEQYPDAEWRDKQGKPSAPVTGWAEAGTARYAWPGHSSFGTAIRADLRKLWDTFPIAGFAHDVTLGDSKYYGPLLSKENGKAFDDDGQIYAVEGVALARNLDHTHAFPPRPDGRRPATITNEIFTYLPMFHADAGIHEMPPYDRVDLVAPRRLLAGQKAYFWWKGFRADSLIAWERLDEAQARVAVTGLVDYLLLMSLRFGIIPAVFYSKGYQDVWEAIPLLQELQKAGWRAASYVTVEGVATQGRPYAQTLPVWVSRFGSGAKSMIVFSAPQSSGYSGKATIRTARFDAPGAIYAAIDGTPLTNTVTQNTTVIAIRLSERRPLILRKVGTLTAGEASLRVTLTPEQPGTAQVVTYTPLNGTANELRILYSDGRPVTRSGGRLEKRIPPAFVFLPNREEFAKVRFGMGSARRCAIVVAEKDRVTCAEEILHLTNYNVYYQTRLSCPDKRLTRLAPLWKNELRLPVITPAEAAASPAETFFVLGAEARTVCCPGGPEAPAVYSRQRRERRYIALFPRDKISEPYLLDRLLDELDRTHPWSGAITERWAIGAKLYGKSFAK
mgnify:CR=1 FL=1